MPPHPHPHHTILLHSEGAGSPPAGHTDGIAPQEQLSSQLEGQLCDASIRSHIKPLANSVMVGILPPSKETRSKSLFALTPHAPTLLLQTERWAQRGPCLILSLALQGLLEG